MSKSYRKNPNLYNNISYYKRLSNKRIRKNPEIDSGSAFKKLMESWMIRDYFCLFWPIGKKRKNCRSRQKNLRTRNCDDRIVRLACCK